MVTLCFEWMALRLDLGVLEQVVAVRLGKLAMMAEGLNFADFVQVVVARLSKLMMVAILNLTGFRQVEAARLQLDGTGQVAVILNKLGA
jgi:hypothetical protein